MHIACMNCLRGDPVSCEGCPSQAFSSSFVPPRDAENFKQQRWTGGLNAMGPSLGPEKVALSAKLSAPEIFPMFSGPSFLRHAGPY